jgi:hypothetical protein
MISWRILGIRLHQPSAFDVTLAEEIKYSLTGHGVGHFDPDFEFADKTKLYNPQTSWLHSAQMDPDPSKPAEAEDERVQQFLGQTAGRSDDVTMILDAEAKIPLDEYELILDEMGVQQPEYHTPDKKFTSLKELWGAIAPGVEGVEGQQESQRISEQLREYIRNNPPMNNPYGDDLINTDEGIRLTRDMWLREIVGPWIREGIPGLPYGVHHIAKEPYYRTVRVAGPNGETVRRQAQSGEIIPQKEPPNSVWIVGKGVFQLPRKREGKVLTTFGGDFLKHAGYKTAVDPEGNVVRTGELTSRARRDVEAMVVDAIAGYYAAPSNYRRELINHIKEILNIDDPALSTLVFGQDDEHVTIKPFPGANQAERQREGEETYVSIILGVIIKLGDNGYRDTSTLFGYIKNLWDNPGDRLVNRGQKAQLPGDLTDYWALKTGLNGLPRVYGAISKSGQITKPVFSTLKRTFMGELQENIFKLEPGATDVPQFKGTKGAFKELRVRDNGDILFIFSNPETANPIYKLNPERDIEIWDPNTQMRTKGAEATPAQQMGMVDVQPPTMPRTPTNIERYKNQLEAEKKRYPPQAGWTPCPTCGTGRGYIYTPQPDGTYSAALCPDCKGQGGEQPQTKDNVRSERTQSLTDQAAALYLEVKDDPLAQYAVPRIKSNKQLSPRQKADEIIRMARYIRARNAGEIGPEVEGSEPNTWAIIDQRLRDLSGGQNE